MNVLLFFFLFPFTPVPHPPSLSFESKYKRHSKLLLLFYL